MDLRVSDPALPTFSLACEPQEKRQCTTMGSSLALHFSELFTPASPEPQFPLPNLGLNEIFMRRQALWQPWQRHIVWPDTYSGLELKILAKQGIKKETLLAKLLTNGLSLSTQLTCSSLGTQVNDQGT